MPSLPILSGGQVVKAFENAGWVVARQRGSHIVKEGAMASLSMPDHKELAKGTLRSFIRASMLTVEAFLELTG